ncbi:hypothetical protein ACE2AJ_09415 [Aquihabitans daechungensis]|uniref:hypothetical protein n=1 Tax=Aquihabitans daechungensis TaxID=1052257 RepID=UPI003BA16B72
MALASVSRSLHGYQAILGLVDRGKELGRRLDSNELFVNLEWAEWAALDTACEFARADPIAVRFKAMAEEAGPDELVIRMLGFGVWGIRCWHHGRIAESAAFLDASREVARQLPQHDLVLGLVAEQRFLSEVFQVHVHDLVGDLADPAEAYGSLVHSLEDRFARAMVAAFQSTACGAIGDLDRAGAASRKGLAADPDVAFSFWGSQNLMHVASASIAAGGDVDEAVARFEDGHARYVRGGAHTGLGLFYAQMALGIASTGDLDRAQSFLDRAQHELAERQERWPEPVILLAEADLLARRGADRDQVHDLLVRAEDLATEQGALAVARRIATERTRITALVA